ncbi:hypothetical protein [Glycomyces tenuis]|uniref:hypothetical protein n=1 Tax=Glycomyces tenuis TaxID=58116 RepID=UPI0003F86DDD|nr:hypothetical protein [Glycomyces tenuis]
MKTAAILAAAGLVLATAAACSNGENDEASDETVETVASAQTAETTLGVVATAAEAYPDAAGRAIVTVAETTSVGFTVTGLEPETDYTSHLHDASCEADPPGGEHWLADPEADMSEDNEIHLHLTTDTDGAGTVSVQSDLIADERVKAIVVHLDAEGEHTDAMTSDRILCGDLELE